MSSSNIKNKENTKPKVMLKRGYYDVNDNSYSSSSPTSSLNNNKRHNAKKQKLILNNENSEERFGRFEELLRQIGIYTDCLTNSTSANKKTTNKIPERKILTQNNNTNFKSNEMTNFLSSSINGEIFQFDKTPSFIKSGELRNYQIEGLNWMISLHKKKINGILADEMGLGKTIQTIAFLGYLKHELKNCGPHLIIVPKSIIKNWLNEFNKWCPSIIAKELIGLEPKRKVIKKDLKSNTKWDVCVTSYDMAWIESSFLKSFNWFYLIIDEGHRIKNEKTKLAQTVRQYKTNGRFLLTGTPLQNNLHELWALLNFLLPNVFDSAEDFDSWFSMDTCLDDDTRVKRLHSILKPLLLRRVKSDVETTLLPKKYIKMYAELTDLQKTWCKKVIEKDIYHLQGNGEITKRGLIFVMMGLIKCINHPYLFYGAEPGPPHELGEHIIYNCGKMKLLDELLSDLKSKGSRVLIFSQMTRVLDIIEDYCFLRKYEYCRIDGKIDYEERENQINEFNAKDSKKFIFMLSTRAGGLGINLATADTVIIYDSDWNPQMDLQAMDRAHRIGQKKQVTVYRLITKNSIEEKINEVAEKKLQLNQIVIQDMKKNIFMNYIRDETNRILDSNEFNIQNNNVETDNSNKRRLRRRQDV